jgi:hypothetical protein
LIFLGKISQTKEFSTLVEQAFTTGNVVRINVHFEISLILAASNTGRVFTIDTVSVSALGFKVPIAFSLSGRRSEKWYSERNLLHGKAS